MSIVSIIIITVLSFTFFYWLNHVVKANPDFATRSLGFKTKTISTYELINGTELERITEYAELCDIVYRRVGKEEQNTFGNWTRILIPIENIKPKDDTKVLKGLYYEVWQSTKSDETIVAIVFRGTKERSDWSANTRWVRRLFDKMTWDHYDQINKILDTIVSSIKSKHSKTERLKIVSIGHSLGGGLAQFTAYANPDIKYIYAFNSSPVTGYYDIKPRSKRIENQKDTVIYRIYESGEALSFVRNFMTILYPVALFQTKNPAIIRIRFNFHTGKNPIFQHSITKLVENLKNYQRR